MSQSSENLVDQAATSILVLSPLTFLFLRYVVSAPYGKHSRMSGHLFGPPIAARVGWLIFESPNLVWAVLCFLRRDLAVFASANALLLGMFCIHYVNRSILYPLSLPRSSRPVPLAVVVSGFSYCALNGYLQSQALCRFTRYPNDYYSSPRFLAGAALFFLGFAINLQSDSILRNLGKAPSLSLVGGEFKYSIPFGGCFQLVSCANYLGEIVEWLGFAIACDNLAALSFFAFTCGNLIPRALSHHDWYRQKFEDYPPQRKAVIPFLL